MRTATGLDLLVRDDLQILKGKSVGLVCNQASVTHDYRHILEIFAQHHREGRVQLKAVFGPQHGLFGHTQDNMIEWEPGDVPPEQFPTYSLYGQHREPTPQMLDGIDVLVIDLQDVGARYYTFTWTMALCIKACAELDIPVMILDRPNPIGGTQVEGTVQDSDHLSFVGLYPLPIRHAMTLGEVAKYLQAKFFPSADVTIIQATGWVRREYLDDTDAAWAMPSPNMPTVDTAVVYPGGCLLEATNLSEGRGTTRPFEIVGAPYLNGRRYADALNALGLPGVHFRMLQFQPTFNKHEGAICEGAFIHVLDRKVFEPVLTFVAIMQTAIAQAGSEFQWKLPPYEYEYEKLPIDILAGNTWLREAIESQAPLKEVRDRFQSESSAFEVERKKHLLYA